MKWVIIIFGLIILSVILSFILFSMIKLIAQQIANETGRTLEDVMEEIFMNLNNSSLIEYNGNKTKQDGPEERGTEKDS